MTLKSNLINGNCMYHSKINGKALFLHAILMLFVLIQIIFYLVKHPNTDKNSLEVIAWCFVSVL